MARTSSCLPSRHFWYLRPQRTAQASVSLWLPLSGNGSSFGLGHSVLASCGIGGSVIDPPRPPNCAHALRSDVASSRVSDRLSMGSYLLLELLVLGLERA